MSPTDIRYVVETAESVITRCICMTTDPGDLVVDPTCGFRHDRLRGGEVGEAVDH